MAFHYDAANAIGIFPASVDIEANTAVKLVAGELAIAGAAERALGVTDQAVTAGDVVKVRMGGIAKVEASAAFAVDALVTIDADGKASAAAASGEYILGQAVEAATGAGQIISVVLILNTTAA